MPSSKFHRLVGSVSTGLFQFFILMNLPSTANLFICWRAQLRPLCPSGLLLPVFCSAMYVFVNICKYVFYWRLFLVSPGVQNILCFLCLLLLVAFIHWAFFFVWFFFSWTIVFLISSYHALANSFSMLPLFYLYSPCNLYVGCKSL